MLGSLTNVVVITMLAKFMLNDVPHMMDGVMSYYQEREGLVRQYGSWAVGRAESICPEGDISCVRKEAARLQQTQLTEIGYYAE